MIQVLEVILRSRDMIDFQLLDIAHNFIEFPRVVFIIIIGAQEGELFELAWDDFISEFLA